MKETLITIALLLAFSSSLQVESSAFALTSNKTAVKAMPLTENVDASRSFSYGPIPDSVFRRMAGKSFPRGCTVRRSSLSYVSVLHYDFEGRVRRGELVCNKAIARDVVGIFRQLYQLHYPIQSIRLIDDFNADDEASMRANNTSCFCFRRVKGHRSLSKHSLGRAIDINPLYNPCVRRSRSGRITIQPSTAKRWANRNARFPHKIDRSDAAYKLFRQHGFRWGGAWRTVKDYQHFEK